MSPKRKSVKNASPPPFHHPALTIPIIQRIAKFACKTPKQAFELAYVDTIFEETMKEYHTAHTVIYDFFEFEKIPDMNASNESPMNEKPEQYGRLKMTIFVSFATHVTHDCLGVFVNLFLNVVKQISFTTMFSIAGLSDVVCPPILLHSWLERCYMTNRKIWDGCRLMLRFVRNVIFCGELSTNQK